MISSIEWGAAAAEVTDEGFCTLMCLDRGNGAPLELWLRTNAGTVISSIVEGTVASLVSVWPEAVMKEREIHESFGVQFDNAESHVPLVFTENSPLFGTHPMLKSRLLAARNNVAWPGAKEPGDSNSSPSRRKSLPMGVVADVVAHQGELI
jgi:NADH-quinone oxidoreductase subunit C